MPPLDVQGSGDSQQCDPSARDESLALLGGEPCVTVPQPHFTWPKIGPAEEQAVLGQLRRAELSLHRRSSVIEELEEAFGAFVGVPHAMSTCSGTAALHAAYFGLDLAPGTEVIVPAYTHLATALSMLHVHLVPVLCEVDGVTGNIDPSALEACITDRTGAIAVTHQYGHPCAMDEVIGLARRHGLKVIEDASHAHGALYKGRKVGALGDVACFSLQTHKAVVAGEGGLLVTSDPAIYRRACLLGHFRQAPVAEAEDDPLVESGYGLKNRLHPLAAALALPQLERLGEVNERRASHYARLEKGLSGVPGVQALPTSPDVERGGYFRFLVHLDPRALSGLSADSFVVALHAEGAIEARSGALARPLHLLPIFQTLDDGMFKGGWPRRGGHVSIERVYRPGDFPVAERFSTQTLQLPAFTYEDDVIVDAYIAAIVRVAAGASAVAAHLAGETPR